MRNNSMSGTDTPLDTCSIAASDSYSPRRAVSPVLAHDEPSLATLFYTAGQGLSDLPRIQQLPVPNQTRTLGQNPPVVDNTGPHESRVKLVDRIKSFADRRLSVSRESTERSQKAEGGDLRSSDIAELQTEIRTMQMKLAYQDDTIRGLHGLLQDTLNIVQGIMSSIATTPLPPTSAIPATHSQPRQTEENTSTETSRDPIDRNGTLTPEQLHSFDRAKSVASVPLPRTQPPDRNGSGKSSQGRGQHRQRRDRRKRWAGWDQNRGLY